MESFVLRWTRRLGRNLIVLSESFGQIVFLFIDCFRCLKRFPIRIRLLLQQILFVGAHSQPVVIVTGAFTGAVFTAQTQMKFGELGMSSAVGPVVSVAMCRELGPVLTALMISGRVGAAMAAEIATMKNSEQIDALRSLAVYPTEYLVVPRVLALMICMPLLVGLSIAWGIAASYFVGVQVMGIEGAYHWENTRKFTEMPDLSIGLVKAFFFGLIVSLIACNKGLRAGLGNEGVGLATTQAVVNASIAVLISNFFFTFLLQRLFL